MTMWKKPEATIGVENEGPTETGLRDPIERPASEAKALLGGSLTFEGTITGAEDLTIEGTVKGIVDLKKHNVVIGKRGRIEGDVFARVISIEGEVLGNVFAGERASIHKSGMVKGNVAAPRVLVEDGARQRLSETFCSVPLLIREIHLGELNARKRARFPANVRNIFGEELIE